uniref:Bug family tripartite tricarboxylate transporter substrate binding protein n=1 Tax=Pararhizobium sp. IMCC3301 TaxID=3067904 RepID=UPI002741C1A2|nr:tripartite tricarboxylate transporter substrate binding protein [Pararhizobium sp. IMCC3301]
MKKIVRCAALVAALFGSWAAQAADFPDGQITLIVPFGAGGGSDRVARTVDRFWQEQTSESFNFQYQPGAAGAVGTDAIARADADGYTIGIVNLPNMVVQPVSGSATFSLDGFDYIGRVNSDPIVLMVPESSPYQTLEDFVAAAKEAPGTMTLAITGTLGAAHIAALQMMDGAEIEVTLVPTQGGANTVARISGGHVSAGLIGLGLFTNQESGRALAVTSEERSSFAADVPTFTEKGIPISLATARIIVAPAGLPDHALTYLRDTLKSVTESEGFITASAEQGQGAIWQDGEALEASVMAMEGSVSALLRKYKLID